jgi:biopolymer transport protein ExbD
MRFPRNATIFRGQLDVAAFAGLFFLLALFLLLASLVYTPGVMVDLKAGPHGLTGFDQTTLTLAERRTVEVTASGEILYQNRAYTLNELEQLRNELKKGDGEAVLVVAAYPASPREPVLALRELARDLSMEFHAPGFPIQLAEGHNLPGTANRTFTMAVNLGGQFFHANQIVSEQVLRSRLEAAVRQSTEPLTLVVLADESTELKVYVRLTALAREAQVDQVLYATQPRVFSRAAKPLLK